jgi:hypothetical protein
MRHAAESGTPKFGAPFDIVVGVLADDGTLIELHTDSRRLMPWAETTE